MTTMHCALPRARRAAASLAVVAVGAIGLAVPGVAQADAGSANTAAAAAQHAKKPKPAYKVGLRASVKEAIRKETEFMLTGKVYGAPKGAKVTLQLKYADTNYWSSVRTAKLDKKSRYSFKDVASTPRSRSYRVIKPGDKTHAKGTSKERAVTVYSWRQLTSFPTSAQENTQVFSPLPINGENFNNSVYATVVAPTGFVEYTLGRKCRELTATFGLSDRTETGGQASIKLTADTKELYSHEIGRAHV